VYLSWLATLAVGLYLARTRLGLNVRAVGEAPASADAMGINVALYRYVHVLVGGAFAGVGGACYSLAIAPGWVAGDVLVSGAGWIAIALVIFAFWRAELCLVGAYLFGGLSALPFALQAHDVTVTPEFLQALPYVMTVVVLVLVSTAFARRRPRGSGGARAALRARRAVERGRGRPHPRSLDEALRLKSEHPARADPGREPTSWWRSTSIAAAGRVLNLNEVDELRGWRSRTDVSDSAPG
jgi:ABC-type uncharacterized transport system permease subunit